MYEHNLELMGGKAAVYAVRFNQWLAGLWHGRPLAYTVAVLAVAIALVCFWMPRLMSGPLPSEPDQGREGVTTCLQWVYSVCKDFPTESRLNWL
jgi:hypothetical protein